MLRHPHVIGFDDAPFQRSHRGDVRVVGAVFAAERLDGVLSCKVRRDGINATRVLAETVIRSRFYPQIHVILLQGIAFAGFNVVDLHALHRTLGRPVVVAVRKRPNLAAIRSALVNHVPGGLRKWRLIERAGAVEAAGRIFVQRAGISMDDTKTLLESLALHGDMPEPLRVAHLIAGGVTLGESRRRV
jgi:endonuclease V-like protein UPF0215 family